MAKEPRNPTLEQIAEHLGVSDSTVRRFLRKHGLDKKSMTLSQVQQAYEDALSESSELDGAQERARLAKAQADKIERENAIAMRQLAPVELMEMVLADSAARIAQVLDGIPVHLRRRNQSLTAADIAFVAGEIARCRNIIAEMRLDSE